MALQSLGAPTIWPPSHRVINASPTVSSLTTLDAAGEYSGVVICAREAMTISHVGFRPGTCTGAPTADIRIETVDATTGLPTGALWAANTNIVSATLVTGTWALEALTASASIARGDTFCLKIAYNNGTSTQTGAYAGVLISSILPYRVDNTGSPATALLSTHFNAALGSGATTFYAVPGLLPASSVANNTFSNSVAGAKRGLKFRVPFKCRVVGARYFTNGASGNFNIILEDSGGSELSSSSTAYDGNLMAALGTGMADCYFVNSVTLSPATDYRVMVQPSSATNCNISTATLPSADYRAAWPHGTNCLYSTYTTAGGYVDTATTQIPVMDLLIDQLDDGAGAGGGLIRHPGMSGGLNG
jgi:hypothetical protein